MQIEVYTKSDERILFRNVLSIDTVVDFIDSKPVYKMKILQINHDDEITIDDINSFFVGESSSTWIDLDDKRITCPHCGEIFKKSILNQATINFCPKCGDEVDTIAYLKDRLNID